MPTFPCSHVNKKALEQYVSFSEQRDNLQMRKEVLDRSKKVNRPSSHTSTPPKLPLKQISAGSEYILNSACVLLLDGLRSNTIQHTVDFLLLPSGSLVQKVYWFALLQAIEELIEHLDQQKDEAIARTFSQVSKYGGLTVTSCTVTLGPQHDYNGIASFACHAILIAFALVPTGISRISSGG
jgi:hypothetical protein